MPNKSHLNVFSRLLRVICVAILLVTTSFSPSEKEEGMFPLAQLNSLDLNAAGLRIPQSDIYSPGNIGLTNALVRLGGCTGSFISDRGLIITNHHCVYGSVASVSSPEKNYLENGFYAPTTEEELKTGLPCRITQSFEDVSVGVLDGVEALSTAVEKKKRISENIKSIEEEQREANPDLEIQISEMFVGKFYTLFRYKLLDDVRLVYVPPQAIGKFGGESDNWVWPRHNGDFSVVRAYENGKPYQPQKHLQIKATGTSVNDFVFVLGYPGRTYRHAPAEFLTYQNNHVLPVISSWFDERIALLENDAKGDPAKKLRYASTLASLHNTTKNFKGKMQGLRRTDIIENRYSEQAQMQAFVDNNEGLKATYGDLLPQMSALYKRRMELADDYFLLNQMYGSSGVFFAAQFVDDGRNMLSKLSKVEKDSFFKEKKEGLLKELRSNQRIFTEDLDRQMFSVLLYRVYRNGNGRVDDILQHLKLTNPSWKEMDDALKPLWKKTLFNDPKKTTEKFEKKPSKFFKQKGKLIQMAGMINNTARDMGGEWRSISDEIDVLMPALAELRELFFGGTFIPDANATLRLTYGYVRGYEPEDAVVNAPYTTIAGILEKVDGTPDSDNPNSDYYMPGNLLEKFRTIQPSDKLVHPVRKKVVVGILYNMDTTGGNSGSPILDADGMLVGINFDRAFSATINDFEWNESYSRSIGVDIRYVLYVMKYLGEADEILEELNVEL